MRLAKLKVVSHSLRCDESGAALVEFAISLLVLAPLLIGTMDLGLAMVQMAAGQ